MTHDEVISAFIDGEPVDPTRLADALADPAGRQSLLDLLRLGALVAEAEADAFSDVRRPARKENRFWLLAAAAALVVGLGSFGAGLQMGQASPDVRVTAAQQDPPKPDRVIELREGIEWRNNVGGL